MSNTDGLSIDLVQRQWEESQQLIGDLRSRLGAIASSSESAQLASISIQAAEASLARLANDSEKMLGELSQALSTAIESLNSIKALAANSDLSSLLDGLEGIAESQRNLIASVSNLGQRLQLQADLVQKLTDSQESLQTTQQNEKAKIREAISSLPGRYRSRFADIL